MKVISISLVFSASTETALQRQGTATIFQQYVADHDRLLRLRLAQMLSFGICCTQAFHTEAGHNAQ